MKIEIVEYQSVIGTGAVLPETSSPPKGGRHETVRGVRLQPDFDISTTRKSMMS